LFLNGIAFDFIPLVGNGNIKEPAISLLIEVSHGAGVGDNVKVGEFVTVGDKVGEGVNVKVGVRVAVADCVRVSVAVLVRVGGTGV